ncbi:hypothetical protein [Virgibacillus sp. MG-45]|uniref:hypothetical protein n=1 Tax=Virgibacillus sp. MG-45 TaxID=3102791 RepID=UPI002EDA1D3F
MEIKVNINAPGLEGAIHTLAQVLANYQLPVNTNGSEVSTTTDQQAPMQQAPSAVPTGQPIQQPTQQPQVQPQQGVPTSATTYTMDQLAVAATQLMDAGKQQDLMSLLGQFNVQALTALPQEQYGAFATKLREMGAKI